ncbi:hypothetical protein ACN6LL_002025 [Streptomyces violaceoruber]
MTDEQLDETDERFAWLTSGQPIRHQYVHDRPRQDVVLHAGRLNVEHEGRSFEATGDLTWRWNPRPQVIYAASSTEYGRYGIKHNLGSLSDVVVRPLNDSIVPQPPFEEMSDEGWVWKADGRIRDMVIGGERDLERVTFSLPNFPDIHGFSLSSGGSHWLGRLLLPMEEWDLVLDSVAPPSRVYKDLRREGGYAVTHVGEFRKRDGSVFSPSRAAEVIEYLRYVLSFACGRWTAPVLSVGYQPDGTPVWADWRAYRVSPWSGGHTLVDPVNAEILNGLIACTDSVWLDAYRKDVFQYAVNYYIDGCAGDPIELATSTFQAGLELLSWAVLVEELQLISRKEYQSPANPAHKVIGRMLGRWNIDVNVPSRMTSLVGAAMSDAANPCKSGPEIITRMRNGVIHPKRRIGARRYDVEVWIDAWQLSQYYLLLATLAYVGYEGSFRSPIAESKYAGSVETVPWGS